MKITLQKSEIEKFLELASYVDLTPNEIIYLPITEFIKVEINKGFCKMTLTSQNSFISYLFSVQIQESANFLISYVNLKKFYSTTKRKEQLIITDTETKTTFSDGNFTSNYQKPESIKLENFPTQPIITGLKFKRIDRVAINQLNTAKKYILPESKDKLRPILNVASIKPIEQGSFLLASDSQISCLYKLNSDFDFSVLYAKEISLVNNFEYFDFITTENWNIIKYKTIVYGNRLSDEINPGSIHETIFKFIKMLDKKAYIKLNVDQFYDFCKSVKSFVKDETVNSSLEVKDGKIELSYIDVQNSIDLHQNIDSETFGYKEGYRICFVQNNIVKVLDSLESKLINISECVDERGGKNFIGFWLDTDENFHSICSKGMEIVKND